MRLRTPAIKKIAFQRTSGACYCNKGIIFVSFCFLPEEAELLSCWAMNHLCLYIVRCRCIIYIIRNIRLHLLAVCIFNVFQHTLNTKQQYNFLRENLLR